MDYVTIEKIEMSSDTLRNDHDTSNAKIKELESIINEMKKKLDKVTEEA